MSGLIGWTDVGGMTSMERWGSAHPCRRATGRGRRDAWSGTVRNHKESDRPGTGAERFEVLAKGRRPHVVGVFELGDRALGHLVPAGQLDVANGLGVTQLVDGWGLWVDQNFVYL